MILIDYRSYEQLKRATAFKKSMSVQAIDLSDELLLAKQEYIKQYSPIIEENTHSISNTADATVGGNSIITEKKRVRGDSIRKGTSHASLI